MRTDIKNEYFVNIKIEKGRSAQATFTFSKLREWMGGYNQDALDWHQFGAKGTNTAVKWTGNLTI
jgi:hypothetical protein